MRAVLTLLFVIALAVPAVASATPAHAKTFIYVTPTSGPAGSTIQIEGFNFSSGEVRLAVVPVPMERDTGFLDSLPAGLISLGTAQAVSGEFKVELALPGDSDSKLAGRVEVLAIREDPPSLDAKFFVAGAFFDVTPAADLPVAGGGTEREEQLPHAVVLLGLGAALLSGVGLLLRRWRA